MNEKTDKTLEHLNNDKVYFPGLNGIRLIAVLLVIVYHIEQIKSLLKLENYYNARYIHELGSVGVKLFFVLSGFLITYLLLTEKQKTSTINVKNFYIRRILRIHPLYFLMVALGFFILPHLLKITIWESVYQHYYIPKLLLFLLFMPNLAMVFFTPVDFVGHLWSVGVEEQFYLIWAPIVKFVKKRFVAVLASISILVLSLRAVLYYISHLLKGYSTIHGVALLLDVLSSFEIECMAIGSIGAYLLHKNKTAVLKIIYNRKLQFFVLTALISAMLFGFHLPFVNGVFYSLLFIIVILNVSSNPKSVIKLENNFLDYMGRISYGLYMYHIIVIALALTIFNNIVLSNSMSGNLFIYLSVILMSTVTASLSYYLFERPFLNLKQEFAVVPNGIEAMSKDFVVENRLRLIFKSMVSNSFAKSRLALTYLIPILVLLMIIVSCSPTQSSITGFAVKDDKDKGNEKADNTSNASSSINETPSVVDEAAANQTAAETANKTVANESAKGEKEDKRKTEEQEKSKEQKEFNVPPVWKSNTSEFVINGKTVIDLNDYFFDQNNDNITYTATAPEKISVNIENSLITLIPQGNNFTATIVFTASDGEKSTSKEIVLIIPEKSITISLEYKAGTPYNTADNGHEQTNGVIDFTVENSKFSWDVNETNLCTRWNVYSVDDQASTTVCYGSTKCCAFVGLGPTRDNWKEPFYSTYGQYGATLNNTVSSQVIYVDYGVSYQKPYADIYYSAWKNLSADYYFASINFENVCVDTCSLSGFNETSYKLIFEIDNAVLNLDKLTYLIAEEMTKVPLNLSVVDGAGLTSGGYQLYKNNISVSIVEGFIEPDYYNIEITPTENVIDRLLIVNVNITKPLTAAIGVENVSRNISIDNVNVEKIFAVNIKDIEFEKATLTATASANSLYKCKQWDYEKELCFGLWEKIKDLASGEKYALTLTKGDPGFIEGNSKINLVNITPLNITNITELVLSNEIPNITIAINSNATINLSGYFSNIDENTVFTYFNQNNLSIFFDKNMATIAPSQDFIGTMFTYITATKGASVAISNLFSINVINQTYTTNITANITPNLILKKKIFKLDEDVDVDFEYLTKQELVKENKWKDEYEVYEKETNKTDEELRLLSEKIIKKEKQFKKYTKQNQTIETSVLDFQGNLKDINVEIEELRDGKFKLKLPSQREFRAGKYTLKLNLLKDGINYTQQQDFSWGVLAINVNKSIYLPNQDAFIGIAVLDDLGHMICNANVTLEITNPSNQKTTLTTQDNDIKISPECSVYGVTNLPDYYTSYSVKGVGTYSMNLTAVTFNGVRSVLDNFTVQNSVAFDVARQGPTRIFPPVPYRMNFTINANDDYSGPISEYVPSSFAITPQQDIIVNTFNDTKIITWILDLAKGKTYELSYEFKAPPISPEFYILGPLEIGNFKEARQWQIASDAGTVWNDFCLRVNATNGCFGADKRNVTMQGGDQIVISFNVTSTGTTTITGRIGINDAGKGIGVGTCTAGNTDFDCANTSISTGGPTITDFKNCSFSFSTATVGAVVGNFSIKACGGAGGVNSQSTIQLYKTSSDTGVFDLSLNITIKDFIPPRINASLNNLSTDFDTGNVVNMTANVSDETQLSFCQFIDNQSLANGAKQYINDSVKGINASDQCSQNYTIALSAGGVINFTVIVNDTANNKNQSTQIVAVNDNTPPSINASLNNLSSAFLNGKRVNMTANVSDNLLLSFCQLIDNQSLPNGAKQFFNKTVTGTSDQCSQNYTIALSAGGVINFTVIVNDTSNNLNQSTQIVSIVDSAAPVVGLIAPLNNTNSSGIVTFTYIVTKNATTSAALQDCHLYGNWSSTGFVGNQTDSTPQEGIQKDFVQTIDFTNNATNVMWNVLCNNTIGISAFNSTNFTLNIDWTFPNVSLKLPANNTLSNGQSVDFSYIVFESHPKVCQLWTNFSGTWQANQTDTSKVTGISTSFASTINISTGYYIWNVGCNDTANNRAFNESNLTLRVVGPDAILPRINASLDDSSPGLAQRVNLTANVSDDVGLSFCQFIDNQSLANGAKQFINDSLTGASDQCSQNYTIALSAGGVINFTVIVNDTSNNLNQSSQIITVGDQFHITNCTNLDVANRTYGLIKDANSGGTCFNVSANNVTLDCHGLMINYSQSVTGYGINNSGFNYTTIRSCNIVQADLASDKANSYGVYIFSNSNNNVVFNNTITTSGGGSYGAYTSLNSSNNQIYSNTITTSGSGGIGTAISSIKNQVYNNVITVNGNIPTGILADFSNNSIYNNNITANSSNNPIGIQSQDVNNSIYGNTITAIGFNGNGIFINGPQNNSIYNNIITTNGSQGFGIYLQGGSNNSIYGNAITTNDSLGTGMYLYLSSSNNQIHNNNITINGNLGTGIRLVTDDNNNVFFGNRISANSIGILMNDTATGTNTPMTGNTFTNDTIVPCSAGCAANYNDIVLTANVTDITFTNVSMNKSRIAIIPRSPSNPAEINNLTVKWYLDINVTNSTDNNAIANAEVSINDSFNKNIFDGLTSITGTIATQTVTEFTMNGSVTMNDSCINVRNNVNITCFNPYNFSINISGYNPGNASVDINRSKFVNISMIITPPPPDTTKPRINASLNISILYLGQSVNMTANVTDETGLSFCRFVINQTGGNVFYNKSVTGTDDRCSQNFTIAVGARNVINFTVVVNDTNNNLNQTSQILTVGSEVPVTNCTTLDTPNTNYTLIGDANSGRTCFYVLANNITLDCHGFKINYSQSVIGYGINNTGFNYTTVRSCNIVQAVPWTIDSFGIYMTTTSFSVIQNNTVTVYGDTVYSFVYGGITLAYTTFNNSIYNNIIKVNGSNNGLNGIDLDYTAYNNSVYSNNITVSGDFWYGAHIYSGSNNNQVYNNTITTSGGSGTLIELSSSNNQVYKNTITTSGGNGYGASISSSSNNQVYSNTITTNDSNGYGAYIYSGSNNNQVYNNTITISGGFSYGAYINNGNSNQVYNNTIITNGTYSYGIYLIANAYNNTIYNNNITTKNTTGSYGIYLLNNVNNNTFYRNTISSLAIGILINGSGQVFANGDSTRFNTFTNDTIIPCSVGCAANYNDIVLTANATDITFTNVSFNKSRVAFVALSPSAPVEKNNLTVKWFLSVNVTNSTNNAGIANAQVVVNDSNSLNIFNGTTDATGGIATLTVTEFTMNGSVPQWVADADSCKNITNVNITCFNPYNFSINISGYNPGNASVDINRSKIINVSVSIGGAAAPANNNPTIALNNVTTSLASSQFSVDPIAAGYTYVIISFNVSDADGVATINASTAVVNLTLGTNSEWYSNVSAVSTSEFGTCFNTTATNTIMIINCSVALPYFANASGSWKINISVQDKSGGIGRNDSAFFTVNVVSGLALPYTAINFSNVQLGQNNVLAYPNLLLNNTGNDDFTQINMSASALIGTITTSETIAVTNFGVNTTNSSTNSRQAFTSGGVITLSDATTGVNTTLQHGHTSDLVNSDKGNISVFVWVNVPSSGISSQLYNATWNVTATSSS